METLGKQNQGKKLKHIPKMETGTQKLNNHRNLKHQMHQIKLCDIKQESPQKQLEPFSNIFNLHLTRKHENRLRLKISFTEKDSSTIITYCTNPYTKYKYS